MSVFTRTKIRRLLLTLGALVLVAAPVVALSRPWQWSDVSRILPFRDGVSLTLSSERQGAWLLSDGIHLYRFDGTKLFDLTSALRERGMQGVSSLASDGQHWLVAYRPQDGTRPQVWLTDGLNWNDISATLPLGFERLEATGNNGEWYFKLSEPSVSGVPTRWSLWRMKDTITATQQMSVPAEVSTGEDASGCVTGYGVGNISTTCSGKNLPVFVNGAWYFLGGQNETRGASNLVTHDAKAGIWRIENNRFTAVTTTPAFKFVSGVWPSAGSALIATSNNSNNPFATDRFWLFDGKTFTDLTDEARANRILSADAREIRAAYDGQSWLILFGKRYVRYDGTRMHDEGKTRDFFQTVSSDGHGLFVLSGAVSDVALEFPTAPLTAKLVTTRENPNADPAPWSVFGDALSDLTSTLYGPSITLTSDPADARIGNGQAFAFRVQAADSQGVERIEIYAQGARVKICDSDKCDFVQTYWTNGLASRTVEFYARATDKQGYANQSRKVKLTIDSGTQNGATLPRVNQPTQIPTDAKWTQDAATGLSWTTWTTPTTSTFGSGVPVAYSVAADSPKGVKTVELWVNGAVRRTCDFAGAQFTGACSYDLETERFPVGTDVFMNANVIDQTGKNVWTSGTTLKRSAAQIIPAPAPAPQPTQPDAATTLTITPNQKDVTRGTFIQVRGTALNSVLGIERIEILQNNAIQRTCTYGDARSRVICDMQIDTAGMIPGSNVNLVVRAIDNYGNESWSNVKTINIRPVGSATTPATPAGTFSVWNWSSPSTPELAPGQIMNYTVGSWSPSGLQKIEMIVDGTVRKVCAANGTGAQECAYSFTAYDFPHGHTVTINARATDLAGKIKLSDPVSIMVRRNWEPLNNPSAFINLTTDHVNGYAAGDNVTLSARGWSPLGVDRIELFLNGSKVQTCPADSCSWTSPAMTTASIDFQAKLIDRLQDETWTGLTGLDRK